MKIEEVLNLKFSSPVLRRVLRILFREGKYYTVRFGRLKGLKSYYRKDINFHTLIGLWETDSVEALDKIIRQFGLHDRDIIVADVGANMGYYTMYFSNNLSSGSRIYAFEPSISILDVLKRNVNVNHLNNVEIVEAACAQGTGMVEFYIGQNHHKSSMLESWSDNATKGTLTKVKSVSIDDFFGSDHLGEYPDLIKIDIEGAAVFALKGSEKCLQQKRPLLLIESHTPAEDDAIGNVLTQHKYEAFRIDNQKWILHKDRNYLDSDGVWGTMLLMPAEKKHMFKS